jgi:hypothetical protein
VGEKVSRRVLLGARKQDRGFAERGRDALNKRERTRPIISRVA